MTALAVERNTKRMISPHDQIRAYPVKGAKKIYKGSLVVLSGGYAEPGATATGLVAVGRAKETVDNSAGADGDLTVSVEEGVFKWANLGADAAAQANVGADVYVTDDQTVSKTDGSSTKSRAGILVQVDSDGVWVQTGLGI